MHHDNNYDRNSMSVSEQVGLPYGSRASSPGASLRRPFTPGGMFPSSASTAGDGRVSRSASTHGGGHGGFAPTALYHSSSTYSLRRPIEPGDRTGAVFTYGSSVLFYPLYIPIYIFFNVKSTFCLHFQDPRLTYPNFICRPVGKGGLLLKQLLVHI